MRIAGVVAALALGLAAPAVALAQSPSSLPRQAAVDVYVEEIPTATGSVAAGSTSASTEGTPSSVSGAVAGGTGGILGLVLVLAGVAAGIVLVRLRSRGGPDSRT
jgi:hypothetical protein